MKPKKILKKTKAGRLIILYLLFLTAAAHAQSGTDTGVNEAAAASDTLWYTQPWLWILIIALVIIAIVYYRRGGGKKNLKEGTSKGPR